MRIGPFLLEKPSAITSYRVEAWAFYILNRHGRIIAIEWID